MSLDQKFPYIPLGRNPLAAQIMSEGCDLLDQMGVKWWVSAGTALGLRRDGGFIYHDTDIDIGCLDVGGRFLEMEDLFQHHGFRILHVTSHQRAFIRLGVLFDVYTFERDGDELRSFVDDHEIRKPVRLVETLDWLKFDGKPYPAPSPVDEYLEIRYGPDWRTPKTEKTYWLEDAANVR